MQIIGTIDSGNVLIERTCILYWNKHGKVLQIDMSPQCFTRFEWISLNDKVKKFLIFQEEHYVTFFWTHIPLITATGSLL